MPFHPELDQPDRCDFELRLRPEPGWPTPPTQRLRLALKCLRRGFGLRAIACRYVAAPERPKDK